MRILYVGNFAAAWSTETYVTHALRGLGCDVSIAHAAHATARRMRRRLRAFQPDVLLLSKRRHPDAARTIDDARRAGVLTACWFWDLLWGYRRGTPRLPQMRCDVVCSTDGGHDAAWAAQGVRHVLLRQGIHGPERVLAPRGDLWDVAFVGGTRTQPRFRHELIGWLDARYGERFRWVQGVRGLPLNEVLARTKVVVGDSYPSAGYWSNRVYEITGRGGFLLHPRVEGLEEEFPEDVVPRFDRDRWREELPGLIDEYLEDDETRETARRAGHLRCEQYTYDRRCASLLTTLSAAAGRDLQLPPLETRA